MKIEDIIDQALALDVYIYVEDDKLKYKAKRDGLTPQLRENLRNYKVQIIDYLKSQQAANKADGEQGHSDSLAGFKRDADKPLLPSYAQQRLWFMNQYTGPSAMYNIPLAMRFSQHVDSQLLLEALNLVVLRHESLRTAYTEHNGTPLLSIETNPEPIGLEKVDNEQQLFELREAERNYPFDLSCDKPCRIRLVQQTDNKALVLLMTMHHSMSDAWSQNILLGELKVLYRALGVGASNPLPELELQYADYAQWQRQWLSGEVLDQQIDYWREQLSGLPALLTLPTDFPRPAKQSYRGGSETLVIDRELSDALKTLSKQQGVTLYMTLMSTFALLLSRYSGQDDVAIGTSIANRGSKEIESVVGFFVNTLVMRIDLSGDPGFDQLLKRTKEVALESYSHQDIPFETLVEALKPMRSLSYSPLFQAFFALHNAGDAGEGQAMDTAQQQQQEQGLGMAPLRFSGDYQQKQQVFSRFDLTLRIQVSEQGIRGIMEYSLDLFTADTIKQMLSAYLMLLKAAVSAPKSALSSLEFLNVEDKARQLEQWNQTEKQFPTDKTVHGLFEEHVAKNPGAPAVIYEDQSLTYGELDARANQLAAYLVSQGVGPEVFVGLCIERGIDMVVGLMAILKAGGAYVPLDANYPPARLQYMLEDCGAKIIVTHKSLLSALPLTSQRCICLDDNDVAAQLRDHSVQFTSPVAFDNSNLAYVIYTSGSTGQPKGVMVNHRNVCDFLYHSVDNFLPPHIVGAVVNSPLAFDATVGSLLVPLAAGLFAELLPEGAFELDRLCDYLSDDEDSFLFKVTPSLLEGVLAKGFMTTNEDARHVLVVAGEPLKHENLRRWCHEFLPQSQFINEYGPTEATVGSTIYPIDIDKVSEQTIVPIGKPLGDTNLYVLSPYLALQPIGTTGELYIGGEGVARGYLKKPMMTAERFIPDPFSKVAGARLYRTGDLVRFQADGNIEFVGRVDGQVKIRGFRIELGEIEYQISGHPEIASSLVLAREEANGDRRLVAFAVKQGDCQRDEESLIAEVKQKLQKSLPDYMVPSVFMMLPKWPLTPNGKIDTKALAGAELSNLNSNSYVAPTDEMQKQLCALFAQVLNLEKVGIDDDFFAVGGHSLLAMRLVSKIREQFQLELPLQTLFESATVRQLSSMFDDVQPQVVLPPVTVVDRTQKLPLSYAQQRLWFIDKLGGGSIHYNMPGHIKLNGEIDVEAVKGAVSALIKRHEVLRTCYVEQDGEPVQRIQTDYELPFERIDLSALGDTDKTRHWQKLMKQLADKPFDLSRDLMLRVCLVKMTEQQYLLGYTLHHIASDGWSMDILKAEFDTLYRAGTGQSVEPLAELKVQYADYALWQRDWLSGEILQQQMQYWQQQLAAIGSLNNLPLDHPRPARQSFVGHYVQQRFEQQLTQDIKALSQANQTTLFMFMQTAFALLLSRYCDEDDIVMSSPISGRNHGDIEPLIGLFVNTLVLRSQIDCQQSFVDLLKANKQMIVDAYANQHVPFEMLVERLQVARDLSHNPLTEVSFVVQDKRTGVANTKANESVLRSSESKDISVKFNLDLYIADLGDQLQLTWSYNKALFERSTITRMAESYQLLLSAVVNQLKAGEQTPVNALNLVSKNDEQRLFVANNQVQNVFDKLPHTSIHQWFEAQVAKTPNAIALVGDGLENNNTISYRELNSKVNRLAHYLIELKTKNNIEQFRVGLCGQRSIDTIVAILAIVKAGGCYVPLDPTYPEDRLDYMAMQSEVSHVVTDEATADVADKLITNRPGLQAIMPSRLDLNGFSEQNPDVATHPLSPVYLIFTSGSTGKPKGVVQTHTSVVNRINWFFHNLATVKDPVYSQKTNLGFADHVAEIFQALCSGAPLIVIPQHTVKSIDDFIDCVVRHNITQITLVPSYIKALISCDKSAPCVRTIVSSGEALDMAALDGFERSFANARLFNYYGSTETGADATATEVPLGSQNADPRDELAVQYDDSIGVAIDNLQLYVLDTQGRPVPYGVPGELYIGGVGLAHGYVGRGDLTAAVFVPHPFSTEPGARLYRSGDRVRYLANGQLQYLGRVDRQIKIRGMRLEPGEIETELLSLNLIKEAVVLCDTSGADNQLVAFIVCRDNNIDFNAEGYGKLPEPLEEEFKRRIGRVLPGYMVPTFFVALEQMPLSGNGKVDRKSLPMLSQLDIHQQAYVEPQGEVEQQLCQMWQQLLKVERVGASDNFFALGGHSLLATRLLSQIGRQFEVQLPLTVIFEAPTVAKLAQRLSMAEQQMQSKRFAQQNNNRIVADEGEL